MALERPKSTNDPPDDWSVNYTARGNICLYWTSLMADILKDVTLVRNGIAIKAKRIVILLMKRQEF